ncbi:MAG TPA: LodA/GoxA family CTQ-dependent oxidase, partial [Nitrososphaeraceae archaeon]|nr:LodA/GoxA family CTQ-dependent oxidase [Nitrososphaeraceae archaeon]
MNESNSDISSVSYCMIHPGIGIARLGNSTSDYFVGPEVPGYGPQPKDGLFKDNEGRVKRQAVRFRIYAYDSNDKVIKELTSDDGSIVWQVHLANRKSAANIFRGFFNTRSPAPERNDDIDGEERERNLVIDSGPITINGINQSGDNFKFNKGKFFGVEVPLGEVRTDEKGRLIVLGGFGRSNCRDGDRDKYPLDNFANNDGWFDDTSDGPVTASVTLEDGNTVSVKDNAWVIVAPPKFAPYHYPIVTLYDTMKQVALDENWIAKPKEVSFMKDIFPILYRVTQYKWLNNRARGGHGRAEGDFLKDIKILSDNKQGAEGRRKKIFGRIRNPDPNL